MRSFMNIFIVGCLGDCSLLDEFIAAVEDNISFDWSAECEIDSDSRGLEWTYRKFVTHPFGLPVTRMHMFHFLTFSNHHCYM